MLPTASDRGDFPGGGGEGPHPGVAATKGVVRLLVVEFNNFLTSITFKM